MSLALLLGSLGGGGEGITQGDIWHGGDSSLYALTVAADLPILWYRMHALNGQIEPDQGSLNQPAIYYNTPTLNVTGALTDDPAVTFDKTSAEQLVGTDNDAYSISTTGFTMEMWAKFTSENASVAERIFTKFNSTGSQCEWAFERFNGANYTFRVFPGSSSFTANATFGSHLADSAFHHFVATVSVSGGTGTLKTYLDGALTDTQTFTYASLLTAGTATVVIGGSEEPTRNSSGTFDEVALYSTPLSATRILAHYSARDPGSTPPPTETGSATSSILFDVIFARYPASVLGTGDNPDLIVNGREAV